MDSVLNGQDCFASLPAGYIDNAIFVLEILKNYLPSIRFPADQIRKRIAIKIVKAR
jgi:hypothetical protein